MQLVNVVSDNLPAFLVSVLDVAADFLVDFRSDILRVVALVVEIAPQEDLMVASLAVRHRAKDVAHAVLGNHAADNLRRALDVAGSAGADFAEHDFLRHAPAEKRLQSVK